MSKLKTERASNGPVIFVDGDRGGAGKSLISQTLSHVLHLGGSRAPQNAHGLFAPAGIVDHPPAVSEGGEL